MTLARSASCRELLDRGRPAPIDRDRQIGLAPVDKRKLLGIGGMLRFRGSRRRGFLRPLRRNELAYGLADGVPRVLRDPSRDLADRRLPAIALFRDLRLTQAAVLELCDE